MDALAAFLDVEQTPRMMKTFRVWIRRNSGLLPFLWSGSREVFNEIALGDRPIYSDSDHEFMPHEIEFVEEML